MPRLDRVQNLILGDEVLQHSLEEGRVEARQAAVDGVLPIFLQEAPPRVGIQPTADEHVARPPAERRHEGLVHDSPQLLGRVEAEQQDVLGRRRPGDPEDDRRHQPGQVALRHALVQGVATLRAALDRVDVGGDPVHPPGGPLVNFGRYDDEGQEQDEVVGQNEHDLLPLFASIPVTAAAMMAI